MVISCAIMAFTDGVIQPGYAVKSVTKLVMFLLIPVLVARSDREIDLKSLFAFKRRALEKR